MGRIYYGTTGFAAVTVAMDLIELVTTAAVCGWIHEIGVSQTSDVADAEEESLHLEAWVRHTVSGSGGSVLTIEKLHTEGSAALITGEGKNTTLAITSGEAVWQEAWNIRIPTVKVWTPDTRPFLGPSQRFVFRLTDAPSDALTLGAYVIFEEMG